MAERRLLDQMRDKIRQLHYAYKTEKSYVEWIKRYIFFYNKRHPLEMGKPEIEKFLTFLATKNPPVSASTQNQACAALLFLYREVLKVDIGEVNSLRAKKTVHVPTVMTHSEAMNVIQRMTGVYRIIAQILYGSGLRLMECMRLRIKDVDFERCTITARDTKSNRDRVACLPQNVIEPLRLHLLHVRAQYETDMAYGRADVEMPYALESKYPNAGREWAWQYVFPSPKLSVDPRSGKIARHHISDTSIQNAMKAAMITASAAAATGGGMPTL